MRTIVAIGGGELKDLDTLKLDKLIVEYTGKSRPRALFIPTASGDSEDYAHTFERVYGGELGCRTDVLRLLGSTSSGAEVAEQIARADLVYVGGGNTLRMMRRWRALGVDKLLLQAYERGTVLSGLSAGAMCWFRYGHSDSRQFSAKGGPWEYIRVKGIGVIPATVCPHHGSDERRLGFRKMIERYGGVGIGLDDCCALVWRDGTYSVMTSRDEARAWKLLKRNGEVTAEEFRHGDVIDIA